MKKFSLTLVSRILVLVLQISLAWASSLKQNLSSINVSRHPIVIVISFDAFRFDLVDAEKTPNLFAIKREGVSVPFMRNQFPTFTFANHQSVATGLHPESHGIVGQKFYDPLYGKELDGHVEPPGFWNYSSNVVPLWTLNEWRGDGRFSGAMMWPGSSTPYGLNNSFPTFFKPFDPLYPPRQRIDDVVGWITHEEKPANLVFLYFNEPDKTGHMYGPESGEFKSAVRKMDHAIGYLQSRLNYLKISHRVNLMLMGDHGMTEINMKPPFLLNITGILKDDRKDLEFFQYSATPILHLLPADQGKTREIYEALKSASENLGFTVYLKEDLETVQPRWHFSKSRRIMPILLVADHPFVFQDYVRPDPYSHPSGHHGYDPYCNDNMLPFFMAVGPLFKSGGKIERPFENIDIFPLICQIMDISMPGHNGSIQNVIPLLRHSKISFIRSKMY